MVTLQNYDFIQKLRHLEVGDGCPFFVAAAQLVPDQWGRRRVVSGRGLSRLEAESRCISEAQERHAAIFDPSAPLLRATPAELGDQAVSLSELLLISEQQYAERDAWNSSVSADHQLPAKISARHPVLWTEARLLVTGKLCYIPAAHCFLGYPTALAEGFPVPDSSGLASGDDFDGALERSLLEVIERDAVSIWWYGRVCRPAMKLEYDQIPCWAEFAAWIRACDRQFWILDLTHDLGIPVAAAVSCNAQGSEISPGFGAARTREQAALAAMGEMVQFELTMRIKKSKGGDSSKDFVSWCQSARVADHGFLRCDETTTAIRSRHLSGWQTCLEAMQEQNLAAHMIDLPSPNHPVCVTRAVVPGLRYLWPRFAPGRLYDVAPRLGWHNSRLSESDLNPSLILY